CVSASANLLVAMDESTWESFALCSALTEADQQAKPLQPAIQLPRSRGYIVAAAISPDNRFVVLATSVGALLQYQRLDSGILAEKPKQLEAPSPKNASTTRELCLLITSANLAICRGLNKDTSKNLYIYNLS